MTVTTSDALRLKLEAIGIYPVAAAYPAYGDRQPLLGTYIRSQFTGNLECTPSAPTTQQPTPLDVAVRLWTASLPPSCPMFHESVTAAVPGVSDRDLARSLKAIGWTRRRIDRVSIGRRRIWVSPAS